MSSATSISLCSRVFSELAPAGAWPVELISLLPHRYRRQNYKGGHMDQGESRMSFFSITHWTIVVTDSSTGYLRPGMTATTPHPLRTHSR